MISRREFVAAACALCAGCASKPAEPLPPEPVAATPPPKPEPLEGVEVIDKPPSLGGPTAQAHVTLPKSYEPVLIWREEDRYYAVSSVCTHEGGELYWKPEIGVIECASHGSRFYVDGAVANGPAERGLEVYDVRLVEGLLEIRKKP